MATPEYVAELDAQVRSLAEDNVHLHKNNEAMADLLDNLLDELEEQYDVDDGPDGQPVPNFAMRLGNMINEFYELKYRSRRRA